ncbi:LCP family protein [Nocardioides marmotae]|uniref:LytR family transcriptional regulator n=1 Tax=Nocardioides marmotae TaxID=2663857 RepID=A0A6I3JA80_9ACTN|nr:LCP family protein [Nocardioides marmotae]MCR6031409.1 LytR family transcriptional regulator [Gordonia jinghuaiqii]MBC9735549.1 LCP family protein [Nocardioides marmotae]MTB86646.1 LytR family transcriptional regulator [Nocardioides marmotae]MTB95048.1 LytR family transcriptional regulator [Nocardioides marmotae]QKE02454.1 LCP family protein [Nocardioides marmotae]
MPPVSSPGLLDGSGRGPRTPAEERAARVRFRRAIALMVMTLLVPGSAQLVAGNRRIGLIALRVWLGVLASGALLLLVGLLHHQVLFTLFSDTGLLLALRLALMVGAIAWAALFLDAWRIGQPLTLGLAHRRAVVGVNGVLCLSVIGTMLFGAHMVAVQRDFILTMFGSDKVVGAHDGRFNVLLLGGDAGAGRWGLRPDSLTVASIDAETGRTVLIGLPRNLANFPFRDGTPMAEEFPDGFDCDGCYLNGVSTWAQDHSELFEDSENPGIDATVAAVEGITDLRINYWALVNLDGFKGLVDAVGGVTLNVRQPIPVGLPHEKTFHYIEPGVRKLNGHDTLWYARAREGSDDYSRMARQKCVMNAMLQQVSPQSAVRNFERIAQASADMISTNLPASELDTFMDLALKARGQKLSTLSLVPPMIVTSDPDIDLVRSKVEQAIDRAEGVATAKGGGAKPKPTPDSVTGGSLGSMAEGYAANQAEDLGAAC